MHSDGIGPSRRASDDLPRYHGARGRSVECYPSSDTLIAPPPLFLKLHKRRQSAVLVPHLETRFDSAELRSALLYIVHLAHEL